MIDQTMTWCLIIVSVMMTIDVITGIMKSIYNDQFSSEQLRKGLFRKLCYVIILFLAWFLEQAEAHVDIGINWPLIVPATVALTMIDLVSILENIVSIDPVLEDHKILSIFTHDVKDKETNDDEKDNKKNTNSTDASSDSTNA